MTMVIIIPNNRIYIKRIENSKKYKYNDYNNLALVMILTINDNEKAV